MQGPILGSRRDKKKASNSLMSLFICVTFFFELIAYYVISG